MAVARAMVAAASDGSGEGGGPVGSGSSEGGGSDGKRGMGLWLLASLPNRGIESQPVAF